MVCACLAARVFVRVAANKTHLLFLSAPCGVEGLTRALQTAMMDKMFSTTLEKSGCYCVRLYTETQNHRIPRMPHALFMCYEKHDSKENGKQLCSTFTVSYHVKCEEEEEDESEIQTGRGE